MKINVLKTVFLSVSLLSMLSVAHADDWQLLNRYRVKDGLVKDLKTGLMWMRCSMGQTWDGTACQGNATRYTWVNAMQAQTHFQYGSYGDWRLPTHSELKSLVYCSNGKILPLEGGRSQCDTDAEQPTILLTVFPQTPANWYWTSSPEHKDWFWKFPFTDLGLFAWVVSFSNGLDALGERSDNGQMRLVRNTIAPAPAKPSTLPVPPVKK